MQGEPSDLTNLWGCDKLDTQVSAFDGIWRITMEKFKTAIERISYFISLFFTTTAIAVAVWLAGVVLSNFENWIGFAFIGLCVLCTGILGIVFWKKDRKLSGFFLGIAGFSALPLIPGLLAVAFP